MAEQDGGISSRARSDQAQPGRPDGAGDRLDPACRLVDRARQAGDAALEEAVSFALQMEVRVRPLRPGERGRESALGLAAVGEEHVERARGARDQLPVGRGGRARERVRREALQLDGAQPVRAGDPPAVLDLPLAGGGVMPRDGLVGFREPRQVGEEIAVLQRRDRGLADQDRPRLRRHGRCPHQPRSPILTAASPSRPASDTAMRYSKEASSARSPLRGLAGMMAIRLHWLPRPSRLEPPPCRFAASCSPPRWHSPRCSSPPRARRRNGRRCGSQPRAPTRRGTRWGRTARSWASSPTSPPCCAST